MPDDVIVHESAQGASSASAPPQDTQPAFTPPPPPNVVPSNASPLPLQTPTVAPPIVPPPYHRQANHSLRLFFLIGGVVLLLVGILFFGLRSFRGGNEHVTLTWWGLWEDKNVMNAIIADFERAHPNITVTYSKEDPKQYTQRLITRIPQGAGPDIFTFHNTWLPMLHSLMLPMSSDVMSKSDFQKYYYPVAQQDLVRNGALYGIPLEIDTLSLFVNTKIFQAAGIQPPTTWDDFNKDAPLMTVKDDAQKIKTSGAALGTYDNITHAPDIMSLMFLQNGADPRDLQKTADYSSQALSFYQTFAMNDQKVWDPTLDPSKIAFSKENLAMYFGYSWDIFDLKSLNPNLNFKVYPVPHLSGGQPLTVASYWVQGISEKSKHPKEALLFMHFLAQKETEQKLFTEEAKTRLFGEPFARIDLAASLKDDPNLSVFISQAPYARSSIFAGETYDDGIDGQLNGYLANAIRSGLNNESASSAIQTLSQGVTQILQQYGQ